MAPSQRHIYEVDMTKKHFLLSESSPSQRVRFLAGKVTLPGSDKKTSWITLTRVGSFTDPRYGRFDITRPMLLSMIKNHESNLVGIDIFIDVAHKPENGAAAKIVKLALDGSRLRALVEWTDYGIDAVKKRGFIYLSAEFTEDYQDNEVGNFHGPVLLGAGLTVRPVIKHLDPVSLSCDSDEQSGGRFYINPELIKTLLSEDSNIMNKYLKALLAALTKKNLSQPVIDSIMKLADDNLKTIKEETAQEALCTGLEQAAVQLSEAINKMPAEQTPVINLSLPSASGDTISLADVDKQVQKSLADLQAQTIKLAETKAGNVKSLSDLISAAPGLDDEMKKSLSEAVAVVVTAETTQDQIKALAELQIEQGNQILASRQLSSLGYSGPKGSPRITVVDEGVRKLSTIYQEGLALSSSASKLHLDTKAPLNPFCALVLSEFDRVNGYNIHSEVKALTEGATSMNSTSLPFGVQREVIREALSDLRILELVQTLTDFTADATTLIPYEMRDTSQVFNDGIVFEGAPIPNAGVTQAMDTAFVLPMKIALMITNEVMHFTRASELNWDAFGRNIESNARLLKELVARRICNELQRSSDAYLAAPVANETFTAQLGSKHTIKTSQFPIVCPFQVRDLTGAAQGNPENPITVTLNSSVIQPFNGTGKQPTGTYYRVVSFNLGVVQFVDQAGVPVVPANTGTNTISYSRSTNVLLFNLDHQADVKEDEHLNGLIKAIGSRKAMMSSQRFIEPQFMLMSATLNDACTNATQFVSSFKRDGSDTTSSGDLAAIKSIPAYSTNAPGIHLGDERVLLGQKNVASYVVAKPFTTSAPIEVMEDGHAVAKKVCYGEEYNVIKVPKPIRNRLTSVVAYSKTARDTI